jgi:uncharacterized FAD-dependent dehydrogenase
MKYDVIIVGAGASGIFAAYELTKISPDIKILVIEKGHTLDRRKCPIDGKKIKSCIGCKTCSIVKNSDTFTVVTEKGDYACDNLVLATGRSGSKWIAKVVKNSV